MNTENKPKRGRKPKTAKTDNFLLEPTFSEPEAPIENMQISILSMDEPFQNDIILSDTEEKPTMKKRGRKPKGGKIIQNIIPVSESKQVKPNVILHLKCSLKDLHESPGFNDSFEAYNYSSENGCEFDNTENFQNPVSELAFDSINKNSNLYSSGTMISSLLNEEEDLNENKEIWKRLKQLKINLHINNISDKKSACFWCTHDFDNPPVYIPKFFIKESYHVYGCFCSPECATAHLMEENIDSSTKFERYHLINNIYSKIYNYTKNIKPAPNPYYLLNKYYGNLSIQEYRSLLKNDRLFLIVDKPLTRILPELHEDNDDFIINNKIIPSNNYTIKKKIQKKPASKANILQEKFGLVSPIME